ncbi:MAG: zinc metalloprotease HtpX [Actinomycetota bacterium]
MSRNTLRTFVFMAALGAVLVAVGNFLGVALWGPDGRSSGMLIFLGLAAVMNLGSYWFSDKIVLAMTRARPVAEADAPSLYRTVRNLCAAANMPMPRLYIMAAPQPNAFATGRNPQHAAVAVTEGILEILSEEELSGVLAHELSHVRNRDILIGAVAATVAAAITMLARMAMWGAMFGGGGRDRRDAGPFGALAWLLSLVLAPIAALLIQMAVSRSREAQADASGAHLLGDATPLAQALIKIDGASRRIPQLKVNPAVSHLFLCNPLRGGGGLGKLFMSHPPLEERLEQLRKLGARV